MINVDENGVRFSIISAKNARYLEEEILEFGEVACGEDGE